MDAYIARVVSERTTNAKITMGHQQRKQLNSAMQTRLFFFSRTKLFIKSHFERQLRVITQTILISLIRARWLKELCDRRRNGRKDAQECPTPAENLTDGNMEVLLKTCVITFFLIADTPFRPCVCACVRVYVHGEDGAFNSSPTGQNGRHFIFWLKIQLSLFRMVKLTITHHWFR